MNNEDKPQEQYEIEDGLIKSFEKSVYEGKAVWIIELNCNLCNLFFNLTVLFRIKKQEAVNNINYGVLTVDNYIVDILAQEDGEDDPRVKTFLAFDSSNPFPSFGASKKSKVCIHIVFNNEELLSDDKIRIIADSYQNSGDFLTSQKDLIRFKTRFHNIIVKKCAENNLEYELEAPNSGATLWTVDIVDDILKSEIEHEKSLLNRADCNNYEEDWTEEPISDNSSEERGKSSCAPESIKLSAELLYANLNEFISWKAQRDLLRKIV